MRHATTYSFAALISSLTLCACGIADALELDTDNLSATGTSTGDASDNDSTLGDSSTGEPVDPATAVDILFVIDDSNRMEAPQRTLVASASALTTPLLEAGFDVRVAVTTTDLGNPWCLLGGASEPENGAIVGTSCRSRLSDFTSQISSADESLCTDSCAESWQPGADPWLSANGTDTAALDEALGCVLPQGVAGCGFESPLEAARRFIERTGDANDPASGFLRDDAHLAIIVVSEEADCSVNPGPNGEILEALFDIDGPRTYWTGDVSPTSAICWGAGVSCLGGDCEPVNRDPSGSTVTSSAEASLYSVSTYDAMLDDLGDAKQPGADVFAFGIVGVPEDYDGTLDVAGGPFSSDPIYEDNFGASQPGCIGNEIEGVPPIRMQAVFEDPLRMGSLYSVCAADYGPSFANMAATISSFE